MKTVFIFGAGASAEAGAPVMSNFMDEAHRVRNTLDQPEIKKAFDEVFCAISEILNIHHRTYLDHRNIESVFSTIEMANLLEKFGDWPVERIRNVRSAMIKLIVKTLGETIKHHYSDHNGDHKFFPPYPYGFFLNRISRFYESEWRMQAKVSFITFNYDLAIDYALHFNALPFNYSLNGEYSPEKFPLLKLHGSLNWLKCENKETKNGCDIIFPVSCNEIKFKEIKSPRDNHSNGYIDLDYMHSRRLCPNCNGLVPAIPFLVPPTWDKTTHYKGIVNVWKRAVEELAEAENIVVIGYSHPESDMFFRYLFALSSKKGTWFKKFLVIDPNKDVGEKFKTILGTGIGDRFDFRRDSFAGQVDALEYLLNNM